MQIRLTTPAWERERYIPEFLIIVNETARDCTVVARLLA